MKPNLVERRKSNVESQQPSTLDARLSTSCCAIELKSNADCVFLQCRPCRKLIAIVPLKTLCPPGYNHAPALANWVERQRIRVEEHKAQAQERQAA